MAIGTMMSEKDALELLEVEVADAVAQCGINADRYERALNRIRYRFAQTERIKPRFNKGKYGKKYDNYTCGNCGHTILEIGYDYCPNCGYGIAWDSPRCLTK